MPYNIFRHNYFNCTIILFANIIFEKKTGARNGELKFESSNEKLRGPFFFFLVSRNERNVKITEVFQATYFGSKSRSENINSFRVAIFTGNGQCRPVVLVIRLRSWNPGQIMVVSSISLSSPKIPLSSVYETRDRDTCVKELLL